MGEEIRKLKKALDVKFNELKSLKRVMVTQKRNMKE